MPQGFHPLIGRLIARVVVCCADENADVRSSACEGCAARGAVCFCNSWSRRLHKERIAVPPRGCTASASRHFARSVRDDAARPGFGGTYWGCIWIVFGLNSVSFIALQVRKSATDIWTTCCSQCEPSDDGSGGSGTATFSSVLIPLLTQYTPTLIATLLDGMVQHPTFNVITEFPF